MNTARAWIELNASAFTYNVTQLKHLLGSTHLAPVIKCNGYGHGLQEIGLLCEYNPHVHMICVAFLSEALELRAYGYTKSILVLSYADAPLTEAVDKNIIFVVDSIAQLQELHTVARTHATTISVHLKIDTGLARRGFYVHQLAEVLALLPTLPHLIVAGVCTHFVNAYGQDPVRTHAQIVEFEQTVHILKKNLPCTYVHISNSSLTAAHGCNLVRVGVALYGYCPKDLGIPLRPILSLKTRIVQIKHVPAETAVGYNATYCTTQPTKLALLPIGYSDGYDQRLSNKGVVIVRGTHAPIRGLVAMNTLMVDVTHIAGVQIGDEVTIIGDHDGVRVPDICARAGIPNMREFMARLNPLLPRIVI